MFVYKYCGNVRCQKYVNSFLSNLSLHLQHRKARSSVKIEDGELKKLQSFPVLFVAFIRNISRGFLRKVDGLNG